MFNLTLKCLVFLSLIFASSAYSREPVGRVEALEGSAWAQAVGKAQRELRKNSVYYSGDHITTGSGSSIRLRFNDKTLFALGARSHMVVDEYTRTRDGDEILSTRILKGAFRFISGLIAKRKPRSMYVGVSVGTIGIRGTHVAGEVIERHEVDGVIVEASAKITLLEPEVEGEKTSIEVSNEYGSIIIDEPGFGTEIPDEHSPPSPVRKMQIRSIQNIMRAIRSSTRRIR